MKKRILTLLMIFMISCTTFSQIKHKIFGLGISEFGALDLDDSTYHILNPVINWDFTQSNSNTFDSENLRYIYKKDGLQNPDTIIVLDAESGNIIQKITVEDNTMSRLEYDKFTNRVYGLGISEFGALDLDDSTYHVINPVINWNYLQGNTFDSENSRYIYKKSGLQNPDTIIVLDAESGNIIQKITVENNTMSRLEYCSYRYVSINNYGYSKTLTLYPNPTYDIINVKTSDFIGSSLIVYNLTGKRLIKTKIISYKTEVDLKKNPKGVYIISVEKNNIKHSSVIMKN